MTHPDGQPERSPHEQLEQIPALASALQATIARSSSVGIVTHARVDADAVGASISMDALCRSLERNPAWVGAADSTIPVTLEYLNLDGHLADDRRPPRLDAEVDLIIFVDCADILRANPAGEALMGAADSRPATVNIDHHVTNSRFADLNIVIPSAAATCEIITDLFAALNVPVDHRVATALLSGIYGDTLGLKTPSTRPSTIRACADLVEAGAHLDLVVDHLFRKKPMSTVLLWGEAQRQAKWRGRLVYSTVTDEMLERSGARSWETEGLVNFLAGVEGAFAAVLAQESDTGWRVSLRSTTEAVDVSTLAQRYGGGGHPRAAGCRVAGGPEALEAFLNDIAEQLDHLPEDAGTRPEHAAL